MNSQTSSFGIKSFLKGFMKLFTNVKATMILGIGIAIMATGIAIAIWMMPTAFLPTIVSAFSSFIGTFIIVGALPRFIFSPSDEKKELEETQRKNLELKEALEKAQKEQKKLLDRLDTFANITKIQPVMKLVTGEFTFDITKYYEDPIEDDKSDKPDRHLITRKYHEDPEFYRGVYNYSGQLSLAVDLSKIKLVESDDTIMLCGPFEYEPKLDPSYKEKWKMRGRREVEHRHGQKENEMETYEINVKKIMEPLWEEKKENEFRENLKNLDIIDSMKPFTDKMVIEFVKLLLAPTGKAVTYTPIANEAFSTKTLGELVKAYNNRVSSRLDSSLNP